MCSQTEDDCYCLIQSKIVQKDRLLNCVKCCGPPAVLVRTDDPALCKSCFLKGCIHKINSAFAKIRFHSDSLTVAIGFSGSLSSSALLQLVIESLKSKRNQKPRFIPKLFHLHDTNLPEHDKNEMNFIMKNSGFEYHFISQESIDEKYLMENIKQSKYFTSEQQLSKLLNLTLLVNCARNLNCSYLMLGSCANRVSTNFLLSIIEGRGSQSSIETAIIDNRFEDITILRPLNEFLAKEVVMFAHFVDIQPISLNNPFTSIVIKNPGITSLEKLTQDFLASLQSKGFPSTTGTILRTSSKIIPSIDDDEQKNLINCQLCHTHFKSKVSTNNVDVLASASLNYSHSLASTNKSEKTKIEDQINIVLCPCCLIIYHDLLPQSKSHLKDLLR